VVCDLNLLYEYKSLNSVHDYCVADMLVLNVATFRSLRPKYDQVLAEGRGVSMKLAGIALAAGVALGSFGASAAFIGSIDLTTGSNGFVSTPTPGAFVDTATFLLTTQSTLAGILASAVSGAQDVDFTSIVLAGPSGPVSFAMAGADPFETWTISTGALSAGLYTLAVTGTNSAGGGTYVGNIAVTAGGVAPPLPEPGTYALMLAALGAMHFVMRRRKAPIRRRV